MYFGLTKETFDTYTKKYIQSEHKELLAIIVEQTQSVYLRMCQDSLDFDTRRDLYIDEVLMFCRALKQHVPDNFQLLSYNFCIKRQS
ncbi:MAG: hypothetical protein RLZZ292_1075 [Bacteroidota bacterium]|jgi:hypothetical protein